jgi:predicted ribosomally synthesized peptide with SipW-like signal peptide
MSIAGLGLIGAGAHAIFNASTTSTQQITAGTMNVTLSSPGAYGNNTPTLTFANFGPTNSSFTTGDNLVTITNNSGIVVKEIESTPGDTYDSSGGPTSANSRLAAEVSLCEVSYGPGGTPAYVIYNGLLSAAPAQAINGTLAGAPGPGNTDSYLVNIYAGSTVNTACGSVTTVGAFAPAADGPNPAATDLSDDAQGGVINPTMTVTYTG